MGAPQVKPKWRPPLALIVSSVLLSIMALPVLIIVIGFRIGEPKFIWTLSEIGALSVALVLTLVVAYVFSRNITGPINALIIRAEEIARGGKRAIQPLASYGTREIAMLSQSFLDLASKLVDRSDYVRSFAAHVSHELKSPLTAIRGAAELLRDDVNEPTMTKAQRLHFLENIIADSERLDRLLLRLRELSHAEIPISAGQSCIDDVVTILSERFPGLDIVGSGKTNFPFSLPVEAASIVFTSLAENAFQHGAKCLDLVISTDTRSATIIVRDNGSGIAGANRDRVFQPFFSTRREQGGTGMGLGIARTMLGSHGGDIKLLETTGTGTTFEIIVPLP